MDHLVCYSSSIIKMLSLNQLPYHTDVPTTTNAVTTNGHHHYHLLPGIAVACVQGYMVVPEGDSATAIERWFYVPWLSEFAEEGGVSRGDDVNNEASCSKVEMIPE